MATLREKILAKISARTPNLVPVEFLGETVFIREMSAAERDEYEAGQMERNKQGKALKNFRARLVAHVVCDELGVKLFTEADVDALGEAAAGDVRRVFDAAAKLNAMTAEEAEAAEKNS